MNVLRNYYEIVFNLDQLLEELLGEGLIEKSNLRDVFNDVIFVGDRNCIRKLYEYQIELNEQNRSNELNKSFSDLIESFSKIQLENKDIKLEINFFNKKRFKYLFNLIGFDYFTELLHHFNIYKIDENECLYLQLGKRLNDQDRKITDKYEIVTSKLRSISNKEFCLRNLEKLGPFNHQSNKQEEDIDDYDENLCLFYEFLFNEQNEIQEFIESKMQDQKKSNLLETGKSGKYHFYLYDNKDQCLNRNLIYENQNLEKCKTEFINKFNNMTKQKLFESIFKKENKIFELIYNKKLDKKLIEFLEYFINRHRECDFDQLLFEICRTPEIDVDFENYDPQKDLYHLCKQEEVAKYTKKILETVINISFIGEDNFKAIYQLFNLIPFQNGNIQLFYSNFYNNIKFTEFAFLKDVQIMDKIKIIDLVIKWLSDYIIDLLSWSFFTIKEQRLRFYRYDYWNKIMKNQMDYWLRIKKINIIKNIDLNNSLNTKFKLNATIDSLVMFSSFDKNSELETQYRLIGQLLNCVCNFKYEIYKNEIDLYNKIKIFYKSTQLTGDIYCLKYKFKDILINVNQDKLKEIIFRNLDQFAKNYNLNNFKLKNLQAFKKIKKIQKQDIYYVDLVNMNLLDNLELNGHYELKDSLIYLNEKIYYELNLDQIKELIYNFISNNILHLSSFAIKMLDGISSNEFITNQMIMLYLNDLIAQSIPKNYDVNPNNLMLCIDETGFLILSRNQKYLQLHFKNLDQLIPEYDLQINEKGTFLMFDIKSNTTKTCSFKKFKLHLNKTKLDYQNDIFSIRNIKSSHSFNLFEVTIDFQDSIIETFCHYFKSFVLDENFFDFDNIIYELFTYFSLFAIQIYHFFLNSHQCVKDQNPALLFNIIKHLLITLFEQLKYYSTEIVDFKFKINFFTVAWLLVKCFLIIWRNRQIEIDLLNKLENYFKLDADIDLHNYDLVGEHRKLFKNVDFCIITRKK